MVDERRVVTRTDTVAPAPIAPTSVSQSEVTYRSSGNSVLQRLIIFLFALTAAIGALEIPAVTEFMNDVLAYLPNVIAAIAIFVVAAAIAGAVAGGVAKLMGDTATGKVIATVVPSLNLVIAGFMILEQLQIAPEIVRIAFAATVGALALGLALAFGLGGREVAGRMLEDAYDKGREKQDEVKDDMRTAKDRGQERKDQAQDDIEGSGGGRDSAPAY